MTLLVARGITPAATLFLVVYTVINFADANDFVINESGNCREPDRNFGNCMAISKCEYVINLIKTYGIMSRNAQRYLQQNTCGFALDEPNVCCPKADKGGTGNGNGTNNGSNQNLTNSTPKPFVHPLTLLPRSCGKDYGNRIIGGERTELDEFPWMAVLVYQHEKGSVTGCGGTLISNRYVLTAAHCIRSIPPNWRLENVRLGEYNMRTDPDCLDEGNGESACADPVLVVPVERHIVHENYMKPEVYRNDIALLRLNREVRTTRYIQPICLPNINTPGQLYWAAGWGQIEWKLSSDVKLKVSLPHFDFQQCASVYASKKMFLGAGQMCAGGRFGKDTCKGDSGGPLMKQVREIDGSNKWVIEGVVSIGHAPCGLPGWPGVYTKVIDYLPWIINHLDP